MSNTQNFNSNNSNEELEDDLLPEYNFDYSKAKPNRFATVKNEKITVKLESDVTEVFKTSEQVNKALRAIISAIPKT
ncbi:MAG: hypothetical protein AB4372_22210 [Xenococcus sp. (in: cyanobacteria)]